METEKKIIGRCPLCGGNVVKTCKGYRCEHNIGDSPSCVLNINAIIGNRKMADAEVAELLEKRRILLDGFATKEGKAFPTVLELTDDGGELGTGVLALEEKHQNTFARAVRERGEVVEHVVAEEFCREFIAFSDMFPHGGRIGFGKFTGRREHLGADEFEVGPRHQPGDDAAGARFEQTVRGDDDVG